MNHDGANRTHTHDLFLPVPRGDSGLGGHVDGRRWKDQNAKIQEAIPAETISRESPTAPLDREGISPSSVYIHLEVSFGDSFPLLDGERRLEKGSVRGKARSTS